MNKKYFLTIILTFGVIFSAACHSIPGNAKVRERVVDCDPDLPIDELHGCIENKAEKYSPVKDPNAYASKRVVLEDYIPTKRSSFKSIKKCYEKDNCIKPIASIPYRYDDLDDQLNLSLYTNHYHTNYLQMFAPPLPECAGKQGCYKKELFRGFYTRYRDIEFGVGNKDFIISQENGRKNIYAVALHAVALDKKYLIITNVIHLSPLNVEERLKKEGYTYPYTLQMFHGGDWQEENSWRDVPLSELKRIKATESGYYRVRDKRKKLPETPQQFQRISLDLRNNYNVINGWRFYEIKDSKDIKEVSISLDKREDPSKIYIKQDADVYEIDIKH